MEMIILALLATSVHQIPLYQLPAQWAPMAM